ncbi:MAG TPA: lytic transglycosylase domain-containing protein [Steroidobacteraceae bacterium]
MIRASALLVGLGLLGTAAEAHADVYSFVDANGVVHYTNVPVDPRYQFLLAGAAETQSGQPYDAMLLAAAGKFDPLIESAAAAAAVEPELLRAVIAVESGFNPRAVSKAGAAGLMQLMPHTADRYGVSDRFDPGQNIHAGARYLKALIARYDNDIKLALAAYNAGEQAVDRCGRCIPRYRETQAYVPRVWQMYQRLLASG